MYNKDDGKYYGYIYLISNDVNDKKYVGQTSESIRKRFRDHLNVAKSTAPSLIAKKKHLHLAISLYGADKFHVELLEEIVCDSKDELRHKKDDREKYYIDKLNTYDPNGYNLTRGGQIGAVANFSPVDMYDIYGVFVQSFDTATEAGNFVGCTPTEVSKNCKGSSVVCHGYVFRYKGEPYDKYRTPDEKYIKTHMHDNRIDQYTLDGKYIRTYENGDEAIKALGVDSKYSIFSCCRGNLHTSYGYKWCFHGQEFKDDVSKSFKPVDMYDMDGNLIKEFPNIASAMEYIGVPNVASGRIGSCCSGQNHTSYGYRWAYHGEKLRAFDKYKNKINQYSKDGEYIATYNTGIEATVEGAKKANWKNQSMVMKAVCNKTKDHYAYGFKWYYANDPDQPDKSKIVA